MSPSMTNLEMADALEARAATRGPLDEQLLRAAAQKLRQMDEALARFWEQDASVARQGVWAMTCCERCDGMSEAVPIEKQRTDDWKDVVHNERCAYFPAARTARTDT